MAAIRSLGLHRPASLAYLIDEGVLPKSCSQDAYTWETFENGDSVDELISTQTHVVWSGGSSVYRVFSFDVEKEPVRQALFANFPTQGLTDASKSDRASRSKSSKNRGPSPLVSEALRETQDAKSHSPALQPDERLERALVVILQSHAQVFFLSGARAIVSFQFEVERAFPLEQGLLLQRRETNAGPPPGPKVPPKTPMNSFALTQSFLASPPPAQQSIPTGPVQPFVKSLFDSVISGQKSYARAVVPFHYHLSDPFNDLGVVGGEDLYRSTDSYRDETTLLDRQERLIYVSNKDEASSSMGNTKSDPLQLAVTVNAAKQTLSVWQLTRPAAQSYWKPHQRASTYDADRKRRRRSSQPGTGAVTPTARQSMGPRESFGGPQESFLARDQVRDDGDLAAKLDPAFQNPRAPGQSSRRISSMLARSDLAGMDMFNEGPGTVGGTGVRRGPSLGAANRSFRNATAGKRDLRNSILSQPDDMVEDMTDEEDDKSSTNATKMLTKLMSSSNGLRIDLKLSYLHSLAFNPSVAGNMRAFTIISPGSGQGHEQITLCIVTPGNRELNIIQFEAAWIDSGWRFQLSRVRQAEDITDACMFRTEKGKKLAILAKTEEGLFEVTLQSPLTLPLKITIPSQPLINFPYNLQPSSPNNKRATGPNRRLGEIPLPLKAIEPGTGFGQVILTDQVGSRHVFYVSTQPTSAFIHRCLETCEAVARPSKGEGQKFLHGWWTITRFLAEQMDNHADREWTAFVVLIFSLCCPLDERHPQTPLRTKRKSGGMLRSSSGATVDLESFHGALTQESRNYAAKPAWLTSASWQWIEDEQSHGRESIGAGLGLSTVSVKGESGLVSKKSSFLIECAQLAREFTKSEAGKLVVSGFGLEGKAPDPAPRISLTKTLLVGLHFLRENLKLDLLAAGDVQRLCPVLAQLGGWVGWSSWSWHQTSFYMTENTDMSSWVFDELSASAGASFHPPEPPSILQYITDATKETAKIGAEVSSTAFVCLSNFPDFNTAVEEELKKLLPRIATVQDLMAQHHGSRADTLARLQKLRIDHSFLETLPEGIAASLRSTISLHQSDIGLTAAESAATLLDREDLALLGDANINLHAPARPSSNLQGHTSIRDYHAICRSTGENEASHSNKTDTSAEMDRVAVTRLIFKEDHRVAEAQRLLHPLEAPTVRCVREPEWSEQDLLEAEQELAKVVAIRTLSVSAGRGLLQYGGRSPLLTERFPTHGFTLSCVMKPSNNNVTAEKDAFTEEKVCWAFFHAGAEAGLSISKNSKGIDTSWIVFNKPPELNNRHAGFLLALGLNGHLKNIAKWVAFKYLTPKHTMTSVGLLLGLAASYIGTMDTLITRLLSVHVTRMLPPGAAELNLSPLTQTTGIMALGLLYYGTQHRRMTEVMLSEMENADEEEEAPLDNLRDEGYRLAAGFALGLINLGQGKNLRGLHDMRILERLLGLAVSTKQVELMHIMDKATAAATIAIALIFMKTEDHALAHKINIPNTSHQFEYIRPDLFLLRTVASCLITWNDILPSDVWIRKRLQPAFEEKSVPLFSEISALDIKDLPLYNTVAGLCLAIGLRYAGSANADACTILITYLDQFWRLARLPCLTYDHRLTRTTVRNCQDVIALAAAIVMAGTGHIPLFRRLRSLHGRTDADTPYGSHLAAHQAIGVLFLAGGTQTFNTSNLAIASLLCAFYPLFPSTVLDNKSHLQAFRHLWVLATEPRCLVVRDIDSHRPISMPIQINLKSGQTTNASAPCLLPDLTIISSVSLADPKYWHLTLDFSRPAHRKAFERHQSIFASRKRVEDSQQAPFITAMQSTGSDTHETRDDREGFAWIFDLPCLSKLSAPDRMAVLPSMTALANDITMRTTAVDDRLVLRAALEARSADELWNLKMLFAWAERQTAGSAKGEAEGAVEVERLGWLEREVVWSLKAELGLLIARMEGSME